MSTYIVIDKTTGTTLGWSHNKTDAIMIVPSNLEISLGISQIEKKEVRCVVPSKVYPRPEKWLDSFKKEHTQFI